MCTSLSNSLLNSSVMRVPKQRCPRALAPRSCCACCRPPLVHDRKRERKGFLCTLSFLGSARWSWRRACQVAGRPQGTPGLTRSAAGKHSTPHTLVLCKPNRPAPSTHSLNTAGGALATAGGPAAAAAMARVAGQRVAAGARGATERAAVAAARCRDGLAAALRLQASIRAWGKAVGKANHGYRSL